MLRKNRLLTAAATLAIAGSAGYVMQNGDALAARFTSADDKVQSDMSERQTQNGEILSTLPIPPTDADVPKAFNALDPVIPDNLVAFNTHVDTGTLTDVSVPDFYPMTCDISLEATPIAGAMVNLVLAAPCYQNQRIEIVHGGLEFADATLPDGSFSVQVPALYEYEPFVLTFLDGRSVETKTLVLTVNRYERGAINWAGSQDLNIHGLENGADFGEPGHVWAQTTNTAAAGQEVRGGFLIELGNPNLLAPKLAEVYSYPSANDAAAPEVELIVEAEINSNSCGTDVAGHSVQISAIGVEKTSDISMAFPACDGQDGYLVLKNLLQNLKIARN